MRVFYNTARYYYSQASASTHIGLLTMESQVDTASHRMKSAEYETAEHLQEWKTNKRQYANAFSRKLP